MIILNSRSVALTFQPQLNQVFYQLLGQGLTWIVIVVTPLVCLVPDLMMAAWRARYMRTPVDILMTAEEKGQETVQVIPMVEKQHVAAW